VNNNITLFLAPIPLQPV